MAQFFQVFITIVAFVTLGISQSCDPLAEQLTEQTCGDDESGSYQATLQFPADCGESCTDTVACDPLWAGQNILAGQVCLEFDAEYVFPDTTTGPVMIVTYETNEFFTLEQIHLWVGDDAEGYPQTPKGSPKNGLFPYTAEGPIGHNYTIVVELDDIQDDAGCLMDLCQYCDETLPIPRVYTMAHAVVAPTAAGVTEGYEGETAWAGDNRVLTKGSWARRTDHGWIILCGGVPATPGGDPDPQDDQCETTFSLYTTDDAIADICFECVNIDVDPPVDDSSCLQQNRWGWTNGPVAASTYTGTGVVFDTYGGAAQCDLTKGRYDGTVTVRFDTDHFEFDFDSATDVITDSEAGTQQGAVYHTQVHIYIGTEMVARQENGKKDPTLAPGQYGCVISPLDGSRDDFTINDEDCSGRTFDGTEQVYIIIHTESCRPVTVLS